MAEIDLVAAFLAPRTRNGNLALFAVGANVGVEQYLDLFPQGHAAMRACRILELEIPVLPAAGATIMRNDEHFPIDNVTLRC